MMSPVLFHGRRLVAAALLLFLATVGGAGPDYRHITVGNIDVVSSMSEARTTRFLHELIEVRETVRDLLGTPVLEPATQIVIFSSQREMNEFYPKFTQLGYRFWMDWNTKWHITTSSHGDTFSIINEWPDDKRYRQEALRAYVLWLVSRALTDCPPWISQGLAEFLCTLEYREGTARLGVMMLEEKGARHDKRRTLAELMQSPSLMHTRDLAGIWRMWLTEDYEANRAKIRALVEQMRRGRPADGKTVSEVFGVPLDEMEKSLHRHMRGMIEETVDRPALTAGMFQTLKYEPATEFDLTMARSLIMVTRPRRPADFESMLLALRESHPDSPRPSEALAKLALQGNDRDTAARHWRDALERGTINSHAYVLALSHRLEGRSQQIDLTPSLTPELAGELRQLADRCVALNPGEYDGYFWMAWIEALAPEPDAARVKRLIDSPVRYRSPGAFVPLGVASIRLRQFDGARALVQEYLGLFGAEAKNRPAAEFLLRQADLREKQAAPGN